MSKIVHRTYPRLLFTGTFFFSSILFSILTFINISNINNYENATFYIYLTIILVCALIAGVSLFYLLRTKVIVLTKSQLIISNFFFPNRQHYNLSEIRTIKRSEKKVTSYLPDSSLPLDDSDKYTISTFNTTIEIIDNSSIIINGIGNLEFKYLRKALLTLKEGKSQFKKIKSRKTNYLLDNLNGVFLNLIWLLLVTCITYSLISS